MKELEKRILGLVAERQYVTFAEIKQMLGPEVFEGQQALYTKGYPNIIIWANMSDNVVDAISELMRETKIYPNPASILTYIVDGEILRMPVAKRLIQYKKPHWAPTVFCTFPYEKKGRCSRKN